MAEFQELIRNFDKIRDYMRDFYVYGYKSRNDFSQKSPRTYDNERRRIESYLGDYMKWDYSNRGKTAFIALDCNQLSTNPLYAAWKAKTFTTNDIMLHFYILDALNPHKKMAADEITDCISIRSGHVFDVQTVRNKCREYERLGMLHAEKQGRSLCYSLSSLNIKALISKFSGLDDAIRYFQGCAPFGEIGGFLMDSGETPNTRFTFKHHYIAHTLEDGILFDVLTAIRKGRAIRILNQNAVQNLVYEIDCIPVKVFVSASTGRRFLCVYKKSNRRFFNYRLDHIKSVTIYPEEALSPQLREKLEKNLEYVWSVSFGGRQRMEVISMKLHIHEQSEKYILERIVREGKNGRLQRLQEHVFLYTKELYDTNDISPWIKTFTGRILHLEGSNQKVVRRFYNDIERMHELYGGDC